ncbi:MULTISPECIES: sulfate ABC transporter permease subunit CysT [Geobacillus]|uniref:Sulfate transport system permease protein CysT n=1 Tax=Geobacillus thermocatenulatus TaxID=33938 RepID=A0A226QCR1_9BACL|nr:MULTISPECIES: sulfate ABC transporter permease subunit CysT [Geobacillus]ASS98514.1 sulfate ABC transporter permease subunit CysT [Geobacillus thermocatenulatus]KLR74128.1 sulfate ABC transporter permease [Geobacillus sp. T6]OXB89270.1 sulfate ABC transporter permease subunit CysT [Geobacillus thermocatenulatus]RAN22485.1 sulfate ABC transporter permease [Geobacillus sp. A8]
MGRMYQIARRSVVSAYLLLLVAWPISAIYIQGFSNGWNDFWKEITNILAWKAIILTLKCSAIVTLFQAVAGTWVAFVLARYHFIGRSLLNALIDLPFSLPTSVSGVMLLSLFGPGHPIGRWLNEHGISILYQPYSIMVGMFFVTFPFVIRTVQPLMEKLDRAEEEASYVLGAGKVYTFFRVLLPHAFPGVIAGSMLAFCRSLSEFGALSIISGNLPGKTQVASVWIYGEIESNNIAGASAVSVVLITIAFVVLLAVNSWQKRSDGY